MFPLGDASRRLKHFPTATVLIIGANALAFMLELAGGQNFVIRWSLVPAHVVAGRDWFTILTAMFMHAGWVHILGNMLFFWVFGPEIEDVMGSTRYFIFYLLGGLAATLAQIIINPASTIPNLGASGAIAGVMGAFLVTYPRDQIRTIVMFFYSVQLALIPAVFLIGVWFVTQLFSELGAIAQVQSGGVAYMAHIGGFIFGAATARLFETRQRRLEQGLTD